LLRGDNWFFKQYRLLSFFKGFNASPSQSVPRLLAMTDWHTTIWPFL